MSITVSGNTFTLKTRSAEYQLEADSFGVLNHVWFGEHTGQEMSYLQNYPDVGFSGQIADAGNDRTYSLDTRLLEYPGAGTGDFRLNAAVIHTADYSGLLDLRYEGYEILNGAITFEQMPYARDDEKSAQTLAVHLKDTAADLSVTLFYTVFEDSDAIVRFTRFENRSASAIILDKAASLSLDFYDENLDLIHFHGRHNKEREFERVPVYHGIMRIESKRGSSSHQHNPGIILAKPDTTDRFGDCVGLLMIYSGSFACEIEKDQLNQTRVVMGIHPDQFSWTLQPNESFTTPQVIMAFSARGLDELSVIFHRFINEHIIPSRFRKQPRPVLINNWEATYFDFTRDDILQIADQASKCGIELLVLDDGWFGGRNSDQSGLGDWDVNEEKLGGPLSEFIGKIHQMGMNFGIWIEPEMINEDSDLYRAHPEWVLRVPGHSPVQSRSQLVLDFANPEAVDYIYEKMARLLRENNISYVKWDMNRSLSDWHSSYLKAEKSGELSHRYVLGVYDLMNRLTNEFPDVLFEGCSGGGGRFDAGILFYSPQIWTSDDTDAHERAFIQYGTSFFYPLSSQGAHVSAAPNHQTGRLASLQARAVMAMAGTFGYELDLNKLTDQEKEEVFLYSRWYKKLQPLIYQGTYYRLTSPAQDKMAFWNIVSPDKEEVLLQGLMFETVPNALAPRIRLKGLDSDASYQLVMKDFKILEHPETFSAKALEKGGISVGWPWGCDTPVTMLFKKV